MAAFGDGEIYTDRLADALDTGAPRIKVIARGEDHIRVAAYTMSDGDEQKVASQLRE